MDKNSDIYSLRSTALFHSNARPHAWPIASVIRIIYEPVGSTYDTTNNDDDDNNDDNDIYVGAYSEWTEGVAKATKYSHKRTIATPAAPP